MVNGECYRAMITKINVPKLNIPFVKHLLFCMSLLPLMPILILVTKIDDQVPVINTLKFLAISFLRLPIYHQQVRDHRSKTR